MLAKIGDPDALFYDHPGWFGVGLCLVFVGLVGELFLHELGHWTMAKLCRYTPLAFSVGEGRVIWRKETAKALFQLHLWPVSGYIVAVKENQRESRLHAFLFVAGGPVFSLLSAWLAFQLWSWSKLQEGVFLHVLSQSCAVITIISLISFIYNVFPHYGMLGKTPIANDGLQMLMALRGRFSRGEGFYQNMLLTEFPPTVERVEETPLAKQRWMEIYRARLADRDHDWFALLQDTLRLEMHPLERTAWYNFVLDLAMENPAFVPLRDYALELATRLLEASPDNEHLKTIVGALLIESGQFLEGKLLLKSSSDQPCAEPTASTRLAYLALADAMQDRIQAAQEKLKQAKKLAPYSAAVQRVIRRLSSGW